MTKLLNSNTNVNYNAVVYKIKETLPAENLDNLHFVKIGYEKILADKTFNVGDLCVYVPCFSELHKDFLSKANLYKDYKLNENKEEYEALNIKENKSEEDELKLRKMKGYFEAHGCVKPLKLRKNISNGIIFPIQSLESIYPELKNYDWESKVNSDDPTFDYIGENQFCQKYLPRVYNVDNVTTKKQLKERGDEYIYKMMVRHYDTNQLRLTMHELKPSDDVTISVKIHGTSFFAGYVEYEKAHKTLWDKIKRFFGIKPKPKFKHVCSSRNNILERDIAEPYNVVFEELKKVLIEENMVVYGEICGYMPNTSTCVQINHDYKAPRGISKFIPYRITKFDKANKSIIELEVCEVIEWTHQIKSQIDNCKVIIEPLTIVYDGKLDGLYPYYNLSHNSCSVKNTDADMERWRNELYEHMYNTFGLNDNEPLCKNKVPREGIVIRKKGGLQRAYKLKSDLHYMMSKDQDILSE